MALEGTGNAMGKKLGAFPVWVWGLIIGGAFVIWYWVSQGGGVTDSDDGETEPITVAPPSGDFGTVPILPEVPGGVPQDEATNAEWLIQATNAAAQAGASFVAAQTALMKYLNGQTLTDAERKIIDSAIQRVGLPPEGVANAPEVTPPKEEPKPTTPKPPAAKDYSTVTSFSVPSRARYGETIAIRVSARWKNAKGMTTPVPTSGRILLKVGNKTYTQRLVAGDSIRVIRVRKGDGRLNGNKVIVSAQFKPWKSTYKTKPSAAAPKTITFK